MFLATKLKVLSTFQESLSCLIWSQSLLLIHSTYTYHGWFCLLLSELSWNCERNVKDYYFSHSSSMLSNQISDFTMYNVHTYISKVMGLFNRGVTRIKKAQKLEVSTFNFVVSKWMPIFKWGQNLAKKHVDWSKFCWFWQKWKF